MKIQIVRDISPTSTSDVGNGLRDALRSLGHEVCSTPVDSYFLTFLHQFDKHMDMRKIDERIKTQVQIAVNKLIIADTLLFRPDVVLVVTGYVMTGQIVEHMKALGAQCALYLTESPYQDKEQSAHNAFPLYDVVFCNERASAAKLGAVYLPHSIAPEIHKPTPQPPVVWSDVYMCGTGFSERAAVLRSVDWSGVRLRLDGIWPDKNGIPGIVNEDVVPNAMLPSLYAATPINLNIHRTTRNWNNGGHEEHDYSGESIGPRAYEVLAAGGFLITDHRAEMDGFLQDGEHLVVYRSPEELTELIRHYLPRRDERKAIAESGRLAVSSCTFSRRCEEIILPALRGA